MKKYIFTADIVRAVAIVMAIGVHLVIPITARPDFFGGTIWWLTFLGNCLFRIGVPLFVILSGYLTLGKEVSIEQNLNRIIKRLLVPLVSFYVIFNVAYAYMAHLRGEFYDYPGIFHNLSKNTHTTLYFLVVLFLIQLLNPLWNLLTEAKNKKLLSYTTNFFLILGAIAYIFYYLSLREGEVFSTFTYWMMWVGYYLYGYIVKNKASLMSKKEGWWYGGIFIIGYLTTVAFGYQTMWLHNHHINDLFYIGGQTYADAYLSVSVMMMAIGGFNLLMRSKITQTMELLSWLKKPVVFIASISFTLYLLHLLVIDTLSKFCGVTPDSPIMPNLAGYLLINTFLTFLITIPLAVVVKRMPGLNRIVGEK